MQEIRLEGRPTRELSWRNRPPAIPFPVNAPMTPDASIRKPVGTRKASDHFDGTRFINPSGTAGQPFSAVPRMLLEPRTRWPTHVDIAARQPPRLDGANAVITFIGHANFLIQTAA